MNVDTIITELYQSDELDRCIVNIGVPSNLQDDFKQELFLIITNTEKAKLIDMHQRRVLKFYVVKLVMNLARQVRNVFHKTYLDTRIVYNDDAISNHPETTELEADQEARAIRERKEAKEIMLLDRFCRMDDTLGSPYYRQLVELIAKHGSQIEVSRLTGIPRSTICESVKKIREHLCS